MPIFVESEGNGNVADLDQAKSLKGRITFKGKESYCKIERPFVTGVVSIVVNSNCRLTIGKNFVFETLIVRMASDCTLEIGDNVGVNGKLTIHMSEPSSVSIGTQCLFGGSVSIMTSDAHSIFDINTRKRINYARSVSLGRRVWVGAEATLLKGTQIGDFSVLGTKSVSSSQIPPFCVAAGNPAKIIKTGVSWCRKLQDVAPDDIMREINELREHDGYSKA